MARLPKPITTLIHQAEELDVDELLAIGEEYVRQPIGEYSIAATAAVAVDFGPGTPLFRRLRERTNSITAKAFGDPLFWPHGGGHGYHTVPHRCVAISIQAAAYAALYGDVLAPAIRADLERCWNARKRGRIAA